ncbi:MAG TPA: zinc-ribbon domain-containing protein [Roseiflexaceae bacterium]|nr:zinc-ribbon domain-containing protein [Roseiflexaceae bacterium]
MPFCPQCGVDNPQGARFCDQCGAMLIPTTGAAPPAAAAPAQPAGAVTCPQCGTAALPGEAFCENCGAPLSAPARPVAPVPTPPYSSNIPPQPTYPPPQPAAVPPPMPHTQQSPPVPPAYQAPPTPPPYQAPAAARTALAPARLVVAATGATLPLPAAAQAVVGRADPVSQFFPDIDLTPHGALDQGVGRKHLRLFVSGGQVMVEDLDSTNGTLLNGRRLAARQPQPLRDGDQISAGKLALRYAEG